MTAYAELHRRISILEKKFSVLAGQHEWRGLSSSGSGDWECAKCGIYTNGGIHDGGPYYPGRGQRLKKCPGRRR